jgi:hypothetical protein
MLYLNPPYFLIDGVSIFPDHADPLQFYYLPMMPRLSTSKDASGADMPSIQLIEYEGAAGTGGFINFDVNIGIDPDALTTVVQKLQQQAHLSDTPRLSPVTFIDGSVRLLILGAQSPDQATTPGAPATSAPATSSGAAGAPRFVIKVQNATKPSLFGDNQATFSVQLDQYGATILEQALQGQMAPIAVVYSLDFVALRPAFNVHLHVDWNRVQSYLDENFHAGFLFFSTDIEKSVEKLIEDRVITIDVDTFVTDADGGKASSGDRDRAVSEVYDMIKNTFFESSLPPPNPNQPDGWDRAASTFKTVSEMALTGGWASVASFSKKQVDLSRTDNKVLDVNISERTAVQRTIYPQGHLSGLLSTIGKGTSLSRFIVKVDLDNPWYQRRHVDVVSHADFDTDMIDSIDVNLTYNGSIKSVSLTKANPRGSAEWSSQLVNGQMVRPVTYTYTVNFTGVDTTQRPGQLVTGELTEMGDTIGIQPRATLFEATVVPIRADALPWDRYPSVEVAARYDDDDNKIHLQASAVLNSQNSELTWPLFLRDPAKRSFSYRLSYQLAAGSTTSTPWLTTDAGKIDIVDPFPAKSTLLIVPAVDWNTTDQVLVHVAYPSNDNPVVQKSYIFNKANPAAQTFVADRQDPAQTSIYYEASIINRNGTVWSVPGSVTTDSFLTVQPAMKGHQLVTIRPEQVDFASAHVTEVDVQLRYVDSKNNLGSAATVKLVAKSDVQSFAYDYVDASTRPEFRADINLDNGQTKSLDWSPVTSDAVTIRLSNLV